MRKGNLKENVKRDFKKLKNRIWTIPVTLMMMQSQVFATGSISTAEVTQATENIKNAVIKLAMPIRRNFSICKYCYNCIENDCKFK